MKISETVQAVADFAPVQLAAEWDNVGFLVGDEERECTGVVTCLDCTEEVIDKAVAEGCNLIVSHHPFIFKGIRDSTFAAHSRAQSKSCSNTTSRCIPRTPTSTLRKTD